MIDAVEFLVCEDHRVETAKGPLVFRWVASIGTGRLLAAMVRRPSDGIHGWRLPSEAEMSILAAETAEEAPRRPGTYGARRRPIWADGRAREFRAAFPQS